MKLHSINAEQRLYVIESGPGFSCYGFDVLDRKARAVRLWVACQALGEELKRCERDTLPALPALGTAEHFAACNELLDNAAKFAARTGKRCPAELVPALIGLEGKRVECEYFGERVRFYVGRSTGWMPVHLMVKTRASSGGESLIAEHVRNVRVIA